MRFYKGQGVPPPFFLYRGSHRTKAKERKTDKQRRRDRPRMDDREGKREREKKEKGGGDT